MSYSGPSVGVGRRPSRTVRPLSRDSSSLSQSQPLNRGITPPIRQQAGLSSASGYSGGGRDANFDDDDWLARSQKNLRQRQASAQSERSRAGSSQSNSKRDSLGGGFGNATNVKRFSDSSSPLTSGLGINKLTRNISHTSVDTKNDSKKPTPRTAWGEQKPPQSPFSKTHDSARFSAQHSARSDVDLNRTDQGSKSEASFVAAAQDADTYLTAVPGDDGVSVQHEQSQEMNWAEMSAKFQLALEAGELEDGDKKDAKPTSAAAIDALKRAEVLVEASRQRADSQRQALQAWIDKLRPEAKTEVEAALSEEQRKRQEQEEAQQEPSGGTSASQTSNFHKSTGAFLTAEDEEEEGELVEFPQEFDDAVGLAVEVCSSASKTAAPKDTSFVPAFLQKYFDPAIAVKAIPHLKQEQKAIAEGDSTVPKSYLTPEVRKGLEQIKRLDQILASRERGAARKRAALERCRQRFESQRQAEINILEEKKRADVEDKRRDGKIEKVRRPLGERLSSCGSSVAQSVTSLQVSKHDDAASSVAAPPSETASTTKKTSKDISRGPDGLPNYMRPRGRDKKRADYSAFGSCEGIMNPGLTGVGEQVANSMSYDLQVLGMDESEPESGFDDFEKDNEDLFDVFVTAYFHKFFLRIMTFSTFFLNQQLCFVVMFVVIKITEWMEQSSKCSKSTKQRPRLLRQLKASLIILTLLRLTPHLKFLLRKYFFSSTLTGRFYIHFRYFIVRIRFQIQNATTT